MKKDNEIIKNLNIYKKEMTKAVLDLFFYISKNVDKDVLIVSDDSSRNDFMSMCGIWFLYINVNGHTILSKDEINENNISKILSIKMKKGKPGVKFIEENENHIAIYIYSENDTEDEHHLIYYKVVTIWYKKNLYNEWNKKYNLNIR